MSKKTSGIEDLAKTLVKQHGVEKAYWLSRDQVKTITDPRRLSIWNQVSERLKNIRLTY